MLKRLRQRHARQVLWKKFSAATRQVKWLKNRLGEVTPHAKKFVKQEGHDDIWAQIAEFASNPTLTNNTIAGEALSAIAALEL